jgi:FAD/FMN-containing dehydrogenase
MDSSTGTSTQQTSADRDNHGIPHPRRASAVGDRLSCPVLRPGSSDYDAARRIALGGSDPRPAVIARPRTDAEVAEVVLAARDTGVPLAVRGGGHSSAGHSTVDDGLVLDLRELTAFEIDPAGRTAWAEAGLTAGEVTRLTAQHGLAVGFGDTGSVGIGGITLGGGVGYLARRHGLTIDNLLAADVVTAGGEVLRVDETAHPDLFWAIRGGGGNFGVVTRFQYQLSAVAQVYGGMLVIPATPATVAGFVEAADAAADELTTIGNVMPCPPMPFVPTEHHGSLVIFGLLCWAGDVAAGEAAVAPFRALAAPLADLLRPMAYPEAFPPEDPDYHPTAVARTLFLDRLEMPEAAAIVDRLRASDAPTRVAQLRVLGGAVGRVGNAETAYAHRDRRIMVNVASFYDGPDDKPRRLAEVEQLAAELHGGDLSGYVNFLGDDGPERVRAAYPGETWQRLQAVKAAYDPQNLFRSNHNIPPR